MISHFEKRMNDIVRYNDENQITQNLIQYIKNGNLINRDIASLNRIIEVYFSKKNHIKSEEKQVINFLFRCLDAHGRAASILFTHLSDSCEFENVIKRLHKSYKGIFDFNLINYNVIDFSYKLINLFEIMKIFLLIFFLMLPVSFVFYHKNRSLVDFQFVRNYHNESQIDMQIIHGIYKRSQMQMIESSFPYDNLIKNQYTIMPFGILGSGKSSNGCALLRKKKCICSQ